MALRAAQFDMADLTAVVATAEHRRPGLAGQPAVTLAGRSDLMLSGPAARLSMVLSMNCLRQGGPASLYDRAA
jgi:hypothetical protein